MQISNKKQAEKMPHIVRSQFEKLGTHIDVQIVIGSEAEAVSAKKDLLEIEKLYTEFTKIFSRFDAKSELSKLNCILGEFHFASQYMREVALLSLDYYKKTSGLYDPRILDVLEKVGYADDFEKGTRKLKNSISQENDFLGRKLSDDLSVKENAIFLGVRMDFSGIAKGYITDQIVEFLTKQQWKNFLIDSGGDIFMRSVDEENNPWTVNVEGIDEKKLMFALSDKAIATSGIGKRRWEIEGKRMHHIINPRKPNSFSFDLKSVSIIAANTTDADVWAKTIFLMGKEGGMLYAREHDIAAVVLDSRGSAWISPKAKEFIC